VTSPEEAGSQQLGVVMYCRSWCGDCMRARRWLDGHGITYTEVDIEAEPEGADVVRGIAGKIVTPTFVIGDSDTCVDFDTERLQELLGID
jgi:mycoredoxin